MNTTAKNFWGYVLRFTVIHVFVYTVIATIFLLIQDALPEPTRIALETFTPYRSIGVVATLGQIFRSIVLALVLSPFYDTFMRKANGWLPLFGLIFGLIALGGPNFLTGVLTDIATRTPLSEFLIGPVEIAFQMLLFTLIFYGWERILIRRRRLT